MKNKPLFTIFLIVFIDLMGFGLVLPLLPFIAEQFHANPLQIGLLGSVYSLFQFLSAPILGRLSDRFGRKKLLVISQLGSMVGYVVLGLANSLPLIFLSRLIDGATGGNISIAQAYIADVTTPKDRARGMGVIGAAFGLGFILGPAIGGLLAKFGFAVPAFFAASVSALTVITTNVFLQETVNTAKSTHNRQTTFNIERLKAVMSSHPLGLLTVIFFLLNLAFSGLQGLFALWTQKTFDWGPTQNGYIFAYIGILAVISQLKLLPWVVDKIGEKATLKLSLPFFALGFFFIPIAGLTTQYLLLLGNGLLVIGNSLANPTIQSIASENVSQTEYGGTLGFLQSSASLGRILGPALGGELFYALSPDAPFISSFLIITVAFIYLTSHLPEEQSVLSRLKAAFLPNA